MRVFPIYQVREKPKIHFGRKKNSRESPQLGSKLPWPIKSQQMTARVATVIMKRQSRHLRHYFRLKNISEFQKILDILYYLLTSKGIRTPILLWLPLLSLRLTVLRLIHWLLTFPWTLDLRLHNLLYSLFDYLSK